MERGFYVCWIIFTMTVICVLTKNNEEHCGKGKIVARPASVLPIGSSVNITCSLTQATDCSLKTLTIMRNSTQHKFDIIESSDYSVSVLDSNLSPYSTTYSCRNACKVLICGIYVKVGRSPDQPEIVNCEQEGEEGSICCLYKKGRDTYIQTTYQLQIYPTNCPDNVTIVHECGSQCKSSLVMGPHDTEYTAVVKASNELGTIVSLPYTFTYFDAVKPDPPQDIFIEFHNSSNICTVSPRAPQSTSYFRLRYRLVEDNTWQMVETSIHKNLTLTDLQPFSKYEFQASCKFLEDKGKWSNWSISVIEQTPEDVPNASLDVWYRQEPIDHKTQNITLFWKNMSASHSRGLIKYYQVVFYKGNNTSAAEKLTITTTWLTSCVDKAAYVIAVTAHNSKGNSPPTVINVTTEDVSELPSPLNIVVQEINNVSVTVAWEILPKRKMLTGDFILEWNEPHKVHQIYTNWIKVPKHYRSAIISDKLMPCVCYKFHLYELKNSRAGFAKVAFGATKQEVPSTGPQFNYKIWKDSSILVTWKEIPADSQKGCIVQYNIYMQKTHSLSPVQFIIFTNQSLKNQYQINNIQHNIEYLIWMTCSNEAGESTRALVQQIYLSLDGSFEGYVKIIVVVTITAILLFGIFCVLFIKQKLPLLLYKIWCNKTVPDPANCSWAKEYSTHKNDKTGLLPDQLSRTSSFEEPDTLEIEVAESGEDIQLFQPEILIKSEALTTDTLEVEKLIALQKDVEEQSVPNVPLKSEESSLYRSLKSHEPIITVPVSDYLVSQEITVDYLPTHILSDSVDDEDDDSDEVDFVPLHIFIPTVIGGGKIRLDAVKINSFVE
ncbi:interleukin-12 receptor subunit beta-2 isoform X2 [Bombina bombina]|nr:interleukin-12 receptor subunit beta-2 isoform X2 [Bombina bombina]XP_053549357.1 interleukin-12 receptor subunit beta-2 isoform X2 [Bombina bombina]XP_053549358.1 interleukin-12 receptor subunit beta-2 isoform X2 [Bombina bombina]